MNSKIAHHIVTAVLQKIKNSREKIFRKIKERDVNEFCAGSVQPFSNRSQKLQKTGLLSLYPLHVNFLPTLKSSVDEILQVG